MATGSLPSRSDVVTVLRELGVPVKNTLLFGPWVDGPPFIVGDGGPITYKLRLTVDGKTVDEAEMRVTFN